jgi:hypothetical protein
MWSITERQQRNCDNNAGDDAKVDAGNGVEMQSNDNSSSSSNNNNTVMILTVPLLECNSVSIFLTE